LHAEEVSQIESHGKLWSVYGQNVFSRKEVSVWCIIFEDGRTALNDHPKNTDYTNKSRTSHTDESCVTVAVQELFIRKKIQGQNVLEKDNCEILHIPWKGTLP
jgi:hypothetical protein